MLSYEDWAFANSPLRNYAIHVFVVVVSAQRRSGVKLVSCDWSWRSL